MRRVRSLADALDCGVVLALVGVAVLVGSCSEKPAAPQFDNPFDPEVGNLLNPRLAFVDGKVVVTWDHVVLADLGEEVKQYAVYRSENLEGPFLEVTTVTETIDHTDNKPDRPGQRKISDPDYYPNHANYYGVTFTTESDRTVNVLGVPRVGIDTPPRVRLSTGSTATPTRHVTVKAQAAGVDEAQVDDDPAFGTPVVVTLSTHSTYFNEGQAAWDFGLAAADDTLQLFVRAALAQGGFSPAGSLAVAVNFDPALTVMEAPVVDPDVHLEVPVTGVERMRFATSEAGLDTAPWIVPERAEPDTTTDLVEFQLSTQQATPEIWAQYEGDFGFDVTTTTTVTPSPVAPATLTIDGGAEFTSAADRRVLVTSQAPNATLMRIGEDPDFTGVPWLAYSDTLTVQLSTPPGLKTLYGWYVNGFDATGRVASNQITLVGESPRPR